MAYNLDVNENTQIGIALSSIIEVEEFTLGEAIPRGTSRAFGAVVLNAKAMGKMFKFNGEMSARNMTAQSVS